MLIPDHEIRRLCLQESMVVPYNPELQNPCSLDVLLGDRLMIELPGEPDLQIIGIGDCSKEQPYLMEPGEFLLAQTQEIFNLPAHVAGQFVLKSSRARSGLNHLMAGFADSGWTGSVLTMELQNTRRYHSLPIWPGMRIGQMVFLSLAGIPERTYDKTGRYNNHKTVMPSLD